MATLTRGEQKALALHRVVAARLLKDPSLVTVGRARLRWLRTRNPAGAPYYDEWQRLLSGPLDAMLDVVVNLSERACALRQARQVARERLRAYTGLGPND